MPEYRLKNVGSRRNWHIIWTEGGQTKRRSTGTQDKTEAEAALEDFIDERTGGGRPRHLVINEVVDAYVEARAPIVVAPQALRNRAKPIKRFFSRRLVRHLTRVKCREYTAKRRERGCSDATIRTELGFLSTALNYAFRERWIDHKPYIEMPPAPPPRDRFLLREEAVRLQSGCKSHHLKLFVHVALHTCARSGAILDLTWDRVYMDDRRIDFNRPGRPRTSKRRAEVPIDKTLYEVLREALELATCDYVIEWGGCRVGSITKEFRRAADRAGLVDVTPHTLRHTAATWMAQKGVPPLQISRMLGHVTSHTTERVYIKHSPEFLREAALALEDRY